MFKKVFQSLETIERYLSNQLVMAIDISDVLYCKYPKILYTNVSDKMSYANSADPDQTARFGAV